MPVNYIGCPVDRKLYLNSPLDGQRGGKGWYIQWSFRSFNLTDKPTFRPRDEDRRSNIDIMYIDRIADVIRNQILSRRNSHFACRDYIRPDLQCFLSYVSQWSSIILSEETKIHCRSGLKIAIHYLLMFIVCEQFFKPSSINGRVRLTDRTVSHNLNCILYFR